MITEYENKRLKLNAPLRGLSKETKINIKVDKAGIPQDPYWRRRVKDSEIDNCVEFIETKSTKTKKRGTN